MFYRTRSLSAPATFDEMLRHVTFWLTLVAGGALTTAVGSVVWATTG